MKQARVIRKNGRVSRSSVQSNWMSIQVSEYLTGNGRTSSQCLRQTDDLEYEDFAQCSPKKAEENEEDLVW